MPDPSTLTDDELLKAIGGEEPTEPKAPEAEAPKVDEPEQPKTPEEPEEKEEGKESAPTPDEEKPPSRREQLRVTQLLEKYGPPRDRTPASQPILDYGKELDADPETVKRLEEDRTTAVQQGRNETLEQVQTVKWETMLNVDAPNIESKYPILNPESPEFYPAVSDAMTREYLNMVGFDAQSGLVSNPGIRWKDFVEAKFELAEAIASAKTAKTTQNIAKQAAATGLRPDGSTAPRMNLNKAPEDMTDEELYASLGQKPPKK